MEEFPEFHPIPPDNQWKKLESDNFHYPEDYKTLMDTYGGVLIGTYLWILNPNEERDLELLQYTEETYLTLKEECPEKCPFALYSDNQREGLIAFGRTAEREMLYWLVKKTEPWWIVIYGIEGDYEKYPMSMSEFLYKVIKKELELPHFIENVSFLSRPIGIETSQEMNQRTLEQCLWCGEKCYGKTTNKKGKTYYGIYCNSCKNWMCQQDTPLSIIDSFADFQKGYQVVFKNTGQVTKQDLIRMFGSVKNITTDGMTEDEYFYFLFRADLILSWEMEEEELEEKNYEFKRIDISQIEQAIENKEEEVILFEGDAIETTRYLRKINFKEKFLEIRPDFPYPIYKETLTGTREYPYQKELSEQKEKRATETI